MNWEIDSLAVLRVNIFLDSQEVIDQGLGQGNGRIGEWKCAHSGTYLIGQFMYKRGHNIEASAQWMLT